MDFTGKTVVITGSTRGIGRAIAEEFEKFGANVVISGVNEERLKSVCAEMKATGANVACFAGDVSKFDVAGDLIKFAIETFGSIDVLVNNAGITRDNLIMRMSEDEFDSVISVNLKGTFNTIKAASRPMFKQRSGAIVNISSIVGQMGNVGQANYAASKAGVIGLTKSVAKEFAARSITCNAVAPGFIDTDMTTKLDDKIKGTYRKLIPLSEFGRAEDVAKAVIFLASQKYITGQILNVDGGFNM
jgi:3-oxoacyl-[acyl-carrier protein] reductase